ncbi:alpha/beta hydrolase [Microbulbifer sp. SSSA002]|uniref:lysophospholipase n=1 Tax=Microbulbifer sp. SSSA002 TaxID=3243376 RepID=UPI0040398840
MEFVTKGVTLHYRCWWVDGALGVVVISHGLGEHSGRYSELAGDLNRAGYSVYALDHYGHGLSEGRCGHIEDFALYSEDLNQFIALVKSVNPGLSLHLLGHSMGAAIACGCVIRYGSVDSLSLSAPGFRAKNEPKGFLLWLALLFARGFPRLLLSSRINSRWLSRDPEVVRRYGEDKLVHGSISLCWFEAFIRERTFLSERLGRLSVPCLLLLPESDKIVDVELSRKWFERLGSKNKQLHCFPKSYHEVFNEVEEGRLARELLIGHLNAVVAGRTAVTQG